MVPNDTNEPRIAPGSSLGPYTVLSSLGAGGMGEVFRARDERTGADVAIKTLRPDAIGGSPNALSRFLREVGLLASLSHPNILAIHDFGAFGGVAYAIVEYLEGETLKDRLRRSRLDWRLACEIGIAIAEGLAACHDAGIIHRDLKPSNIFLVQDGRVKVLDFGMARLDANEGTPEGIQLPEFETGPGRLMGTGPFMSPELLCGLGVDTRGDIFSFGCVLYSAVTGRVPFSGTAPAAIMASILRDTPPTFASLGVETPVELEQLIAQCLHKDATKRIQSAQALAIALRAIHSGAGSEI